MTDKIHQQTNSSQDTLTGSEVRGMELGEEEKLWKEVASSEARLGLMRTMIKEQLAFADLEEFGKEFSNKLKTLTFKDKKLYSKVSKPAMEAKLVDEQIMRRDLMRIKKNMKKELEEKLGGIKTRKYKRAINHLNEAARKTKEKLNEKYKNKIKHIRSKYRNEEEDEGIEIPEDIEEFSELSVFTKEKFEKIRVPENEVKTIGEIELSEDERSVLKLHTKFALLETLKKGGLDAEQEASIAKLRMETNKEKEYEGFTEEERKENEILEAENRMIFDPINKVHDNRKKRATDIRECARITLPKPLTPDEESRIEVRKRTQKETYENYREKNTNKKGDQKSNLTKGEKNGLKSLKKRMTNEEIIVMKTDKSGKFVVTTPENYIKMGEEHTKKDEEVSWDEVREKERIVSQHTKAWDLIWRTGENHDHTDRIIKSKSTRSGNQASLKLLYKDHKVGNKTRPVATGNESYNVGLSNSISEIMESVAKSIENPYSVISSEDMMARIHDFNKKIDTENGKKPENPKEELDWPFGNDKGLCMLCVMVPCVCTLLKVEEKIKLLRSKSTEISHIEHDNLDTNVITPNNPDIPDIPDEKEHKLYISDKSNIPGTAAQRTNNAAKSTNQLLNSKGITNNERKVKNLKTFFEKFQSKDAAGTREQPQVGGEKKNQEEIRRIILSDSMQEGDVPQSIPAYREREEEEPLYEANLEKRESVKPQAKVGRPRTPDLAPLPDRGEESFHKDCRRVRTSDKTKEDDIQHSIPAPREKSREESEERKKEETQDKVGRLRTSELAPLPEKDEESFHKDCLGVGEGNIFERREKEEPQTKVGRLRRSELETTPENDEEQFHKDCLEEQNNMKGEEKQDQRESLSLVGSDVVALYPSLSKDNTARIVKKKIIESEVEFKGFDTERARAYIKMNTDEVEDLSEIEHLLPERIAKSGTPPTMASITSNWNPKRQWEFPETEVTEREERVLIATVVEIALKILFANFTYKFGGKYYHQKEGGPIGVRATGAASTLVMEDWAEIYKEILVRSCILVLLLAGYVDDGRQITTVLKDGMRYNKEEQKFTYSKEAEDEDREKRSQGESKNQKMARICLTAMNSVNPDLKFTTETQEDFPNERLPTLDFEMWINQDNKVTHSYFQKEMKTSMVIMERSAMAKHQKFQILRNELSRRLSNIQVGEIKNEEITSKVEQFVGELKNSGYKRKQAAEITIAGIRSWKSKIKSRERANIPFYRPAKSTIGTRLKKQLLEKENWYKDREDSEEEDTECRHIQRTSRNSLKISSWNKKKMKAGNIEKTKKRQTKTVIFVPHTNNSELAVALREKEGRLEEITGDRIKIVERGGQKLENVLTGSDPWKGLDCGRKNCFLCITKSRMEKKSNRDCTKRNILYEIRCLTCEEKAKPSTEDPEREEEREDFKTPVYIGESSRSAYERGFEHLNNYTSLNSKSQMLKHAVEDHSEMELDDVKWGMFILEYKRTSFERQIGEAVKIKEAASRTKILNSRSEWNQSSLPSLVMNINNKEQALREIQKEMREEKEQEEEIEKKIRELRKKRNKERLITEKNKMTNKRQKINEDKYISIREKWGHPQPTSPRKKKMEENPEEIPNKKVRKNTQIEVLTNLRRIPDKVIEGTTITDFEIEITDWEKRLEDHKNRIEMETKERIEKLERKTVKEKSWQLYKECQKFLEENERSWEIEKLEREAERKKRERIVEAKAKQENLRLKIRERNITTTLEKKIEELPTEERKRIRREEELARRREIIEMKKKLWKLRGKEKKYKRTSETTQRLENIKNMENKLSAIEELLEEIEKEKEKIKMEKKEQEKKSLEIWRRKIKEKDKKEQEKKEKMRKCEALNKHWEMMKWITQFIDENKEKWEEEQIEKEMVAMQEIYEWEKASRLEKIEKIKNKEKEKLQQKEWEEKVEPDWENWRDSLDKEKEKEPRAIGRTEENQAKVGRLRTSELAPLPKNDEEPFHKDCLGGEDMVIDQAKVGILKRSKLAPLPENEETFHKDCLEGEKVVEKGSQAKVGKLRRSELAPLPENDREPFHKDCLEGKEQGGNIGQTKVGILRTSKLAPLPKDDEEPSHKDSIEGEKLSENGSQAKVGRLRISELAPMPENDREPFHKDCLKEEEQVEKRSQTKVGILRAPVLATRPPTEEEKFHKDENPDQTRDTPVRTEVQKRDANKKRKRNEKQTIIPYLCGRGTQAKVRKLLVSDLEEGNDLPKSNPATKKETAEELLYKDCLKRRNPVTKQTDLGRKGTVENQDEVRKLTISDLVK